MKKEKKSNKIKSIKRQKKTGVVVSKKMSQSAIVRLENLIKHPYYQKRYKIHRRICVDDKKDAAKVGDKVEIEECRPISKTKRWRVVEVL
ncbi:MAG: small subunit ribosomal protein S17 [Candidatus Berkelbacteria bacterium Licking1014_96]|uniref:Small ribosomal subunit protein uS17 n=1 Tax=Candidatus Berkelbacteria bacterium Licking1014_96 TaxID=2017149 RepID=A0A554LE66_9BACT|nr:MAG: small subunit ribosomal protein S17 [Candidatus Berkelbacteria bacterium Licking1014_96]